MTRFFIRTFLCILAATGLWAQQTEVVLTATSSAKLVLWTDATALVQMLVMAAWGAHLRMPPP